MIELKNVSKSYNNEKVLKDIDLTFSDCEFICIMGASGSGKSTLLNILGGFLPPDNGEVLWDGQNAYNFSDKEMAEKRHSSLGFVFQSFKLISTLTAYDNIILPATLGKSLNQDTLNYIDSLIETLNLKEVINKYPDRLSGGQCQRVAIARALSYKPKTIILDEPTGALDSHTEKVVMKLLKSVNNDLKTTVIMVTHSEKVASFATRIIRIKDGQIQK